MTKEERLELYKKFNINEEVPEYFSEDIQNKVKNTLKGQPTKYTPEEMIEEFFKYVKTLTTRELEYIHEEGELVDIKEKVTQLHATKTGFALFLGVSRHYLYETKESIKYDYSDTLKIIDNLMEDYNATIIDKKEYTKPYDIFFMKNVHHWTDRIETKNENTNTNTNVERVIGEEPLE